MATKRSPIKSTPKTATSKKPAKPVKAIAPKEVAKKISKTAKISETAVATRKTRTVKVTPSKPRVSVSLNPKPSVAEPVTPHDDISLRAYYIGERRQKMGWTGDSSTDWLDAVSQLKAEALEKPLKKR